MLGAPLLRKGFSSTNLIRIVSSTSQLLLIRLFQLTNRKLTT